MSQLTDDQFTLLMIANNGDILAPIGRWKESVFVLVEKGLLVRHNEVNYGITLEGKKAVAERDREDEAAFGQLLSSAHQTRSQAQQLAEQAAQNLATAARNSSSVTGDDPIEALRQWSEQAVKRALELLR
ncbi:MAG: hypothetical protein KGL39_17350 [Patescibacteria group bacterium]|nr:hypothetical protein [Patescibacteria group bacterium]